MYKKQRSKSDGTVVNTSYINTRSWKDIIAIAAGEDHVVGLKADGTVVGAGEYEKYDLSDWKNIVAIAAGDDYTVGLKSDGTVVTSNYF